MAWNTNGGKKAEDAANLAIAATEEMNNLLPTVEAVVIAHAASTTANLAIIKARDAEDFATDANEKSTTALTLSETVKSEFDRIVAEAGDSNPEVVLARGNYVNLPQRLDTEITGLTQQLEQTTQQLERIEETINGINLSDEYTQKLKKIGLSLSTGMTSATLLLLGDSTGNEKTEWFYRSAKWLSEKFPEYSFTQRLWSDTHQNYSDEITYIQSGSNGDGYATFNGVDGFVQTADSPSLRITGDLELIINFSMNDFTPATDTTILMSKFGGPGNRGWALGWTMKGKPYFWWSEDGTNLLGGVSTYTEASVAATVADGEPIWLKVLFDVDNGNGGHTIKYYTSKDGENWTQLGDERTGVGTTSIYPSTSNFEISSRGGGTNGFLNGKIYKLILKNGIDGKIVASPDFGMAFPSSLSKFKDAEGNQYQRLNGVTFGNGSPSILILNGSKPGADLGYSANNNRFTLQTPVEPNITFISYGHNETTKTEYTSEYQSLINKILTKYPNTLITCVTQNPQKTSTNPYVFPQNHAIRNEQIFNLAKEKGYGLIDAYHTFIDSGVSDLLINSDGVHPLEKGSELWSNVAKIFLSELIFD